LSWTLSGTKESCVDKKGSERDIDGLWLKTEAGGGERLLKKKRRKQRVNASYCWNAVATCSREDWELS